LGNAQGQLTRLVGYRVEPGPPTRLILVWQALARTEADYTVFLHALDSAGQVAAQRDAQPRAGNYPTSLWEPGEYIEDDYAFDLPPGTYTFAAGLYLPETGERLTGPGASDAIPLAPVQVP
jgi:hypothetical protein